MKVQLNTDNHVDGGEAMAQHVETVVEDVLGRFSRQVSRVEVHLSDVNADKTGGGDKQCMMEARIDGRPPVTASDEADNMHSAINGAARKLQRVLESSLGRLSG